MKHFCRRFVGAAALRYTLGMQLSDTSWDDGWDVNRLQGENDLNTVHDSTADLFMKSLCSKGMMPSEKKDLMLMLEKHLP